MELAEMLNSMLDVGDWDAPFFKRLASNDTGEAKGHQSGLLLPKKLRDYFPELPSGQNTASVRLQVDLYLGVEFIQRVNSRYQYHTWEGTRPPETRITDKLRPLLGKAVGGDFLVMRRHLDQPNRYCFQLIREGSAAYKELQLISEKEKGAGVLGSAVLATRDIDNEETTLRGSAENDESFDLFSGRERRGTHSRRPVRRAAFAQLVLREYGRQCCVCGSGMVSPAGQIAVEAAHIVPVAAGGIDDPRNALALCRNHHWAFDNGLFTVSDDLRLEVSGAAGHIPENDELKELAGKPVSVPESNGLQPRSEALAWHRENVFIDE